MFELNLFAANLFVIKKWLGHLLMPLPFSLSLLLLALLLLGGMFMATRTAFGRRIYAIGGNLEAARLSGINVERTKLAVFAINGLIDEQLANVLRKGSLRPGDALILTKPLGTGSLFAASPQAQADAQANLGFGAIDFVTYYIQAKA